MIHVLYSSILYEGTKVLSYESTKVSYCTKVLSYESNLPSKVQYNYFRTLLVRKYESTFVFPEVRRSTLRISTTYVYYLRVLLYESTKVQLHVHARVHVHVAIFTGSFINTRSYCTTTTL